MKRLLLFVQGGGARVHDEWDSKLVESLRQALGPDYEVRYPRMPDEGDPNYAAWSAALRDEFARLDDGAIVIGHSVGGTILINALAEQPPDVTLGAIFLIAAPFVGEGGWPSDDGQPRRELGGQLPRGVPIYLYHGLMDTEVPPSHAELHARAIPQARLCLLAGRDHQLNDDLREIAAVIKALAAASDDPLESGLIGGAEKRTITIADYDPEWPKEFERHAAVIAGALGATALRIEHIGSTSVPELAAKPIIDILVVVPDSADEAAYLPQLEAAGYVLRVREPEWNEHRMLRTPERDVQIHVLSAGCPEIGRYLAFRNRLRRNAHDRRRYEQTKRELAARTWADMNDYANAKTEVVESILAASDAADPNRPATPT